MSDAIDKIFANLGDEDPGTKPRKGQGQKKRKSKPDQPLRTTEVRCQVATRCETRSLEGATARTENPEEGESIPEGQVDDPEEVLIVTYATDGNCLHECVRPKNFKSHVKAGDLHKLPACSFPYELDSFQRTAIKCLELGESVLVSAHTSAGKTTVAEYAIAMSIRDSQRVIYTSPIKALSNQKYRDLMNVHHKNVGLLTGDVSLNTSAPVIIMTTEILRSMLYKGSKVIKEMKWVIFDEIHYMRDRDRGVVWEETIILLPENVRLVFLSATIPNAREFAEWICRVKRQPCHVIYTDRRPVPLQHYLFPVGGDGVHLVMDENKNFREENFHKALSVLQKSSDSMAFDGKQPKSDKPSSHVVDIEKIVLMCHERNFTPVILFSFSKREVENNALSLKKIKLSSPEEERIIETIYENAINTLDEEDRNIPQITCMLPILRRGIGLHHGGLLPIIKEIIEILFQESLVKVLFSTETFSMGINVPAKTVVFTKLKKYDGKVFRLISSGEYIQMSGRAGRRGLDDRGISIIMIDEQIEPDVAKDLFLGQPLKIESQFHLGYNMLLNLLRVDGVNPEYLMKRSFFQFQQDKATLELEEEKKEVESRLLELEDITQFFPKGEPVPCDLDLNRAVSETYTEKHRILQLTKELNELIMQPRYVLKFLQVGRVVRISTEETEEDWGFGIVVDKVQKKTVPSTGPGKRSSKTESIFLVPVAIKCGKLGQKEVKSTNAGGKTYRPCVEGEEGFWRVVPCKLSMIREITQVVANISLVSSALDSSESLDKMSDIFNKISEKLNSQFPLLDPLDHMKIDDNRVEEILEELREAQEKLINSSVEQSGTFKALYQVFEEKVKLNRKKQALEEKLASKKSLILKDVLSSMYRVLRKLGYIDEAKIVSVKGKAACEISTVDEIVLCELLFERMFNNMTKDHIAATLSCFVFEEKCENEPPRDSTLLGNYEKVRQVARKVAEVSADSLLSVDIPDYVEKFKPALMETVLKWMREAKFSDLELEDLFEGSVVRAIRRLEELLRQLVCAAKIMGNTDLQDKFVEAIGTIRRGIIFSASLYL